MKTAPKMIVDEKTLALANAMTGINNDDSKDVAGIAHLVQVFGAMTQDERDKCASGLRKIARVLTQPGLFRPRLFVQRLKIPVQTREQAQLVQQALIGFGCGFDNGTQLIRSIELGNGCEPLIGVHVSPKGVLGLTMQSDQTWFDNCGDYLVTPVALLGAKSLTELNDSIDRSRLVHNME